MFKPKKRTKAFDLSDFIRFDPRLKKICCVDLKFKDLYWPLIRSDKRGGPGCSDSLAAK